MRRKGSNIFSVGFHSHTKNKLNSTNPRHQKTPFKRLNVVTMSLSTSMSPLRTGKEGTRVDSRRKDLILFPTRITGRMHIRVSQEGAWINKFFIPK
jgi:hypothetical protein